MAGSAWRELETEILVDSPWLHVRRHRFEQPSGHVIPEYYITDRQDAALTVAIADGEFVMVRQYRPGVKTETLCHPGGRIEGVDQTGQSAAIRELLEETGLQPIRVRSLGSFAQIPAVSSSRVHVFLVEADRADLVSKPDVSEDLSIERLSKSQLMAAIEDGTVDCLACVTATLVAFRALDE